MGGMSLLCDAEPRSDKGKLMKHITKSGITVCCILLSAAAILPAQNSQETAVATTQSWSPVDSQQHASNDIKLPAPQQREPRYQVQPGDSFNIKFPNTPEFNQPDVPVQPDGYITLQAIGEVFVAGKTLPELRKLIRDSYSTIVSPQVVTVELKDFEKPYFVVGGEVGHPGKFELRGNTSVAEAVAIAGGFRDTAKHSQVLLFRRVSDQWMEAKKLDMKKMLAAGNLSEDLHLRAGDIVFVPKNTISKIKPFLPVPGVGIYGSPF
jgi:polysaccharide export outer membrane protein